MGEKRVTKSEFYNSMDNHAIHVPVTGFVLDLYKKIQEYSRSFQEP